MAVDADDAVYHLSGREVRALYMHLLDARSPAIRMTGDRAADEASADRSRRASLDRALAILGEFERAEAWFVQWERGM